MSDLVLPAFIAGVFALAGLVKGVIGLGLPTIAMGLLGLVMAPPQAAALLVAPSLATNIWQAVVGRPLLPLLRRLWPLLLGICLGSWAGADLMTGDSRLAAGGLGVALMAYAGWGLAAPEVSLPSRLELWLGLIAGFATGVVTAATGVFVLPAVPYLQALKLAKDDLVQALGLSFTVSTGALAAILLEGGVFETPVAGMSMAMLLPAFAGVAAGQWLRGRIGPRTFRTFFFAGLLLLGGYLALRNLA